jgi:hypothetical protein
MFYDVEGFFEHGNYFYLFTKNRSKNFDGTAFALGFLLVWSIIEGIMKGVLIFKIFPESSVGQTIMNFFPLEAMSNLIIEPFSRLSVIRSIGTQIGVENTKDYGVHYTSVLIVMIWTFLFVYFSYKLLKKRDL